MSLGRMIVRQLSPITDQLFLTSLGGVQDDAMLMDAQITHVLNVARELHSQPYPDHLAVRFVDLRDSEDENIFPHLEELADHIHRVVTGGGRIVVHCRAGMSRSATVCLAYLVKHHGMSLREAHRKVKDAREIIYPNMGFWTSLIEFELQFRAENSVELMPYVAGTIPSIESYKKEMSQRIKLGWMDYVFYRIFYMSCLFLAQMVSVLVFRD